MQEMIKMSEIPANPTFESEKTFVGIIFLNIKPEWYELSREERIGLTRTHMKELTPYAEKVARTHLRGTGISKYDTVEILEAENLQDISAIVKGFRASAKAKYMEIADVITTIKGEGDLVES